MNLRPFSKHCAGGPSFEILWDQSLMAKYFKRGSTSAINVQWVRTSQWARKRNLTILLASGQYIVNFDDDDDDDDDDDLYADRYVKRMVTAMQRRNLGESGTLSGCPLVHSASSTPDPEISHKLTEEELDGLVVSDCRAFEGFMQTYSTSFSWFTGIFTSLSFQFWSCWSDLRTCRSDQLIWLDFTNFRFHHGFCFIEAKPMVKSEIGGKKMIRPACCRLFQHEKRWH